MSEIAGAEALVIVLLLLALIYGQPVAIQDERAQLHAAQTQIARPTATPVRICPNNVRC